MQSRDKVIKRRIAILVDIAVELLVVIYSSINCVTELASGDPNTSRVIKLFIATALAVLAIAYGWNYVKKCTKGADHDEDETETV